MLPIPERLIGKDGPSVLRSHTNYFFYARYSIILFRGL